MVCFSQMMLLVVQQVLPVTINQPAQALAATYTTVNACNVPTASVTVTPTGGTANYRYSFVIDNTTPGTYGTSNVANLNPTTSTTGLHISLMPTIVLLYYQ
jgi:hypothetical protein